jgi:chromate transport protein ChrA
MVRDSTKPSVKKLLLSALQVGLMGLGSGTNLVLTRELFVDRHKFCSIKTFQNAYGLVWLFPGPIATKLIVYLSYRTLPKWWVPYATLFLFSTPGFLMYASFFHIQQFIPEAPLNKITTVITFCFMFGFCISALQDHFKTYLQTKWRSIALVSTSVVLAFVLKPTLVQALLLYVCGFLIWRSLSHIKLKLNSIVFDPFLWTALLKATLLLYGGVYATIPYLHELWVVKYQLVPSDVYWQAVGIGHIIPGPLLNYVGYIGIAQGSIWHGYLMAMTILTLPSLLTIPVVKMEKKILKNESIVIFFKYLFPFLITQISIIALTLSYERTHHFEIMAILIGMAALKTLLKIRFIPFLGLTIILGLLYYGSGY